MAKLCYSFAIPTGIQRVLALHIPHMQMQRLGPGGLAGRSAGSNLGDRDGQTGMIRLAAPCAGRGHHDPHQAAIRIRAPAGS